MRSLFLLACFLLLTSCNDDKPQYNGYIDADLIYLSSDFAGRLTHLQVHRGERVLTHQALFKLEQTREHYDLDKSELNQTNLMAQRQEIIAQLQYNEINLHRTLNMKKQDAASQNDLDLAKRDQAVLQNQRLALDAQLKSNQINSLDKQWKVRRKEGFSSEKGLVFDTYYTKDEYVPAGQPILSIITPQQIKVVFFVPETKLSQLRLNDHVSISSDGNQKLARGTINYISTIAQYTPPIIYSREDRQDLVFRVEARIDHPDLEQVHLGQPVTMEIVK